LRENRFSKANVSWSATLPGLSAKERRHQKRRLKQLKTGFAASSAHMIACNRLLSVVPGAVFCGKRDIA
jgi:hypothetical protein